MADPPLIAGAVKLTVALLLPDEADKAVGALAVVIGVTLIGVEATPEPTLFTARIYME